MPVGGGETAKDVSGWTVDTVNARLDSVERELLRLMGEKDQRDEQRFRAQQEAFRSELASLARAVDKAEQAYEKRFEGVNEFRQQLGDQARDFMPRREAEQLILALRDSLGAEHERVNLLDRRQGEITAARGGGDKVWAYVLAAVGLIVGVIGIVTRFA